VDTVYFGGGTPSLLSAEQVRRIFAAPRGEFDVTADAEITVECAPGQLGDATLDELLRLGMNRGALGCSRLWMRSTRGGADAHTRDVPRRD